MSNLTLWQSVEQTDPKYTKGFKKGGGFSGTAINATYQVRRATELWGPLGGKWGYSIISSQFVAGADKDIVHILQIEFRHPEGSFPSFGQTTFVGSNKNGAFTDEEAPKKSLTDALTKALSMLGFSADVFLGLYDDNKYVAEVAAKFAAPEKPKSVARQQWESLSPEEQKYLADSAIPMQDELDKGNIAGAYERYEQITYDNEIQQAAFWSLISAPNRSALKAHKESLKTP